MLKYSLFHLFILQQLVKDCAILSLKQNIASKLRSSEKNSPPFFNTKMPRTLLAHLSEESQGQEVFLFAYFFNDFKQLLWESSRAPQAVKY